MRKIYRKISLLENRMVSLLLAAVMILSSIANVMLLGGVMLPVFAEGEDSEIEEVLKGSTVRDDALHFIIRHWHTEIDSDAGLNEGTQNQDASDSYYVLVEGYILPNKERTATDTANYHFYLVNQSSGLLSRVTYHEESPYIGEVDRVNGKITLNVNILTSGDYDDENFAGFSLSAGRSAVTPNRDEDGNYTSITITYDPSIHLVKGHVFYTTWMKTVRGSGLNAELLELGENPEVDTVEVYTWTAYAEGKTAGEIVLNDKDEVVKAGDELPDGCYVSYYKPNGDLVNGTVELTRFYSTSKGLHTNKTLMEDAEGRVFLFDLEAWYAEGSSAWLNFMIDASGSMAFAYDTPDKINVYEALLSRMGKLGVERLKDGRFEYKGTKYTNAKELFIDHIKNDYSKEEIAAAISYIIGQTVEYAQIESLIDKIDGIQKDLKKDDSKYVYPQRESMIGYYEIRQSGLGNGDLKRTWYYNSIAPSKDNTGKYPYVAPGTGVYNSADTTQFASAVYPQAKKSENDGEFNFSNGAPIVESTDFSKNFTAPSGITSWGGGWGAVPANFSDNTGFNLAGGPVGYGGSGFMLSEASTPKNGKFTVSFNIQQATSWVNDGDVEILYIGKKEGDIEHAEFRLVLESGSLMLYHGGTGDELTSDYNPLEKQMFTFTYDASERTVTFYVNDKLTNTVTGVNINVECIVFDPFYDCDTNSTATTTTGGKNNQFWVDDIFVYNAVLGETEVPRLVREYNSKTDLDEKSGVTWENVFLTEEELLLLLNPHKTDNTLIGAGNYTYFVHNGTEGYIPIGYWEGVGGGIKDVEYWFAEDKSANVVTGWPNGNGNDRFKMSADVETTGVGGMSLRRSTGGIILDAKPSNGSFTISFRIRSPLSYSNNGTYADPDADRQVKEMLYIGSMSGNTAAGGYYRLFRDGGSSSTRLKAAAAAGTGSKIVTNINNVFDGTQNTNTVITLVFDANAGTVTTYQDGSVGIQSDSDKGVNEGAAFKFGSNDINIIINGIKDGYTGREICIDDIYVIDKALKAEEISGISSYSDDDLIGKYTFTNSGRPIPGDDDSRNWLKNEAPRAKDNTGYGAFASALESQVYFGGSGSIVKGNTAGVAARTSYGDIIGALNTGTADEYATDAGWYFVSHRGDMNGLREFNTAKRLMSILSIQEFTDDLTKAKYKPSAPSASKFYIDEEGYLQCFVATNTGANNVLSSYVYELADGGYVRTEAAQRILGNFTNQLAEQAPGSYISALRYCSHNYTTADLRKELLLLDWTNDSVEVAQMMSNQRGNGGGRDTDGKGQYNFTLTGSTDLNHAVAAYNQLLQEKVAERTKGTDAPKFIVIFGDGAITGSSVDNNGDVSSDLRNAMDDLKKDGYTVVAVIFGSRDDDEDSVKEAGAGLRELVGKVDTKKEEKDQYFFAATDLDALLDMFNTEIINQLAQSLTGYTVQDYIDPRFDLENEGGDIWHLNANGEVVVDLTGNGKDLKETDEAFQKLTVVKDLTDAGFQVSDEKRSGKFYTIGKTDVTEEYEEEVDGEIVTKTQTYKVPTLTFTLPDGKNGKDKGFTFRLGGNTTPKARAPMLIFDASKDMYYLEWTNQTIPSGPENADELRVWCATIKIRAKEDFIGGNAIITNGNDANMNWLYHPLDLDVSDTCDRAEQNKAEREEYKELQVKRFEDAFDDLSNKSSIIREYIKVNVVDENGKIEDEDTQNLWYANYSDKILKEWEDLDEDLQDAVKEYYVTTRVATENAKIPGGDASSGTDDMFIVEGDGDERVGGDDFPSKGFPRATVNVALLKMEVNPIYSVVYMGEVISPAQLLATIEDEMITDSYYLDYLKRYAFQRYLYNKDSKEANRALWDLLEDWLEFDNDNHYDKSFSIPYMYLPSVDYDLETGMIESGKITNSTGFNTEEYEGKVFKENVGILADVVGILTYRWEMIEPHAEKEGLDKSEAIKNFVKSNTERMRYAVTVGFTPLREGDVLKGGKWINSKTGESFDTKPGNLTEEEEAFYYYTGLNDHDDDGEDIFAGYLPIRSEDLTKWTWRDADPGEPREGGAFIFDRARRVNGIEKVEVGYIKEKDEDGNTVYAWSPSYKPAVYKQQLENDVDQYTKTDDTVQLINEGKVDKASGEREYANDPRTIKGYSEYTLNVVSGGIALELKLQKGELEKLLVENWEEEAEETVVLDRTATLKATRTFMDTDHAQDLKKEDNLDDFGNVFLLTFTIEYTKAEIDKVMAEADRFFYVIIYAKATEVKTTFGVTDSDEKDKAEGIKTLAEEGEGEGDGWIVYREQLPIGKYEFSLEEANKLLLGADSKIPDIQFSAIAPEKDDKKFQTKYFDDIVLNGLHTSNEIDKNGEYNSTPAQRRDTEGELVYVQAKEDLPNYDQYTYYDEDMTVRDANGNVVYRYDKKREVWLDAEDKKVAFNWDLNSEDESDRYEIHSGNIGDYISQSPETNTATKATFYIGTAGNTKGTYDSPENRYYPGDRLGMVRLETGTVKLTIWEKGGKGNESFLYRVTGTTISGADVDITVSVKGGSYTTIDIIAGEYTVTEIPSWSWRYRDGEISKDATYEERWTLDQKGERSTDRVDCTMTDRTMWSIQEASEEALASATIKLDSITKEAVVTYTHDSRGKTWVGGEHFKNYRFE